MYIKTEILDNTNTPCSYGTIKPLWDKHTNGIIPDRVFPRALDKLAECIGKCMMQHKMTISSENKKLILSEIIPPDLTGPVDLAGAAFAQELIESFTIKVSIPTPEEIHASKNPLNELLEALLESFEYKGEYDA